LVIGGSDYKRLSLDAELQTTIPSLELKIIEMMPHKQCLLEKIPAAVIPSRSTAVSFAASSYRSGNEK
jgi:hypothetical protein